jgi:hypothetical protein
VKNKSETRSTKLAGKSEIRNRKHDGNLNFKGILTRDGRGVSIYRCERRAMERGLANHLPQLFGCDGDQLPGTLELPVMLVGGFFMETLHRLP